MTKKIRDIREEVETSINNLIDENDVIHSDLLENAIMKSMNKDKFIDDTIDINQLPTMIIMRRKAIRVFPDGQKVALYWADKINKYISVPFQSIGISESVMDEYDKYHRHYAFNVLGIDPHRKNPRTNKYMRDPRTRRLIRKTQDEINQEIENHPEHGLKNQLKGVASYEKGTLNQKLAAATVGTALRPLEIARDKLLKPVIRKGINAVRSRLPEENLNPSFAKNLQNLREQTATMPLSTAGSVTLKAADLAKKYGPAAMKYAKDLAPVLAGNLPKVRMLGSMNPVVMAAQIALTPTELNAGEAEWIKNKNKAKKKESEADTAKRDAAANASVKAANQKTYDALKDATKQLGTSSSWTQNYEGTKQAKDTRSRLALNLAQARAEKSAATQTYPGQAGSMGMGDIAQKRADAQARAERSAETQTYPGMAGNIGLGDIAQKKAVVQKRAEISARAQAYPGMAGNVGLGTDIPAIRVPKKAQDVAGAEVPIAAANAKAGSTTFTDKTDSAKAATAAANAKGQTAGVWNPPARKDVTLSQAEKKLEADDKARAAAQAKGKSQVKSATDAIAAAQAGEKATTQSQVQAGAVARSQAATDAAVEAISRTKDRKKKDEKERGKRPPFDFGTLAAVNPERNAFRSLTGTGEDSFKQRHTNLDTWQSKNFWINLKAQQAMARAAMNEQARPRRDRDHTDPELAAQDAADAARGFEGVKPERSDYRSATYATSSGQDSANDDENDDDPSNTTLSTKMKYIQLRANQAMARAAMGESVVPMLKDIINEQKSDVWVLKDGSETIVPYALAKNIINIYESMNRVNKARMRDMLCESKDTFNKVAKFVIGNK